DANVGFVQVHAALAMHEERQLARRDLVFALALGVVEIELATHRGQPVDGGAHGVDESVAARVLVVVEVALGALALRTGVERVDEHGGDRAWSGVLGARLLEVGGSGAGRRPACASASSRARSARSFSARAFRRSWSAARNSLKAGVNRRSAPSTGSNCTRDVGVIGWRSPAPEGRRIGAVFAWRPRGVNGHGGPRNGPPTPQRSGRPGGAVTPLEWRPEDVNGRMALRH